MPQLPPKWNQCFSIFTTTIVHKQELQLMELLPKQINIHTAMELELISTCFPLNNFSLQQAEWSIHLYPVHMDDSGAVNWLAMNCKYESVYFKYLNAANSNWGGDAGE